MPQQTPKPRSAWEKFARLAMATTSLSVGVMANSTTITEGTSPAPADFPNSAPGYLLSVGTTTVHGTVTSLTDTEDWFEFQGLQKGQAFSLQATGEGESGLSVFVYNSSNVSLGQQSLEEGGATVTGTIPADGKLIVEMVVASERGSEPYAVGLTAPLAPQSVPASSPLSLSVLGLGLALSGGLAWRSKRAAWR